jgi:hypothetical protein
MKHPFANHEWKTQAIGGEVIRYLAPIMCECVAAKLVREVRR